MGEALGHSGHGRTLDKPDEPEGGLGGQCLDLDYRRFSDGRQTSGALLGEDGFRWAEEVYGNGQVLPQEDSNRSVHDDMAWESFAKLWLL